MGKSAWLFGRGLARHFLFIVPGGCLLGVLSLVEHKTGKAIAVPGWAFWAALGAGLLLAAFLTFHDLLTETAGANAQLDTRYDALKDLLGRSLSVGADLSTDHADWPLLSAWKAHTRQLVACAYGDGEAAHVFTPELGERKVYRGLDVMSAPPPLAGIVNSVRALIGRMQELRIRSGFDPADWAAFDPDAFKAAHAREAEEGKDKKHWKCPWCGREVARLAEHCSCGAELTGDHAYRIPKCQPT